MHQADQQLYCLKKHVIRGLFREYGVCIAEKKHLSSGLIFHYFHKEHFRDCYSISLYIFQLDVKEIVTINVCVYIYCFSLGQERTADKVFADYCDDNKECGYNPAGQEFTSKNIQQNII